jgi:hypothetical protein
LLLNAGIVITVLMLKRAKRPLPGLTIPIILWFMGELLMGRAFC